jgi:hypothetical protein
MQEQIKGLMDRIHIDHPWVEFFKEGPVAKEVKTNLVATLLTWEEKTYIKAFTEQWKLLWKAEKEMIDLFNTFSLTNESLFSGPDIIDYNKDPLYFTMTDIEKTKQKIDFASSTHEELIKLYDLYREVFSEFEKFSWGKSTSEIGTMQKYMLRIKKLEEKIRVLKMAFAMAIKKQQQKKLNAFMSKWRGFVEKSGQFSINEQDVKKLYEELYNKVSSFDMEYDFGRLWTGHVFTDGTDYSLVDFDNVWYQIQNSESLWIVWSNVLLAVEKYNSYDDWAKDFYKWFDYLKNTTKNESLLLLQLFMKIVATIYADYWHLMIANEKNRSDIIASWFLPEENAKKWIEWNGKLLQELFVL